MCDKFVKGAVAHYKGRSVIYEIENEPEFDHWDNLKEQYARFTIRTARLIKQIDPKARVMVDNVYGIPSGVNAAFFKSGGLKFVDVMSWHDYHEGWLADGVSMKRMRQNIDEAESNSPPATNSSSCRSCPTGTTQLPAPSKTSF